MSMLTILSWGGWTSEAEAALGPGILGNHHEFTIETMNIIIERLMHVGFNIKIQQLKNETNDVIIWFDKENFRQH